MRFDPTNPKAIKPTTPVLRPRGAMTNGPRPTPSIPTPVNPGTRGNVETNYRGIPGLVNATAPVPALGKKPTPSIPTPVNPGVGTGGGNFADAILGRTPPAGGGAAPSQPAMTNKIGTSGFKNMSPATLQSGMKKGGSVKGWGMARGARKAKIV